MACEDPQAQARALLDRAEANGALKASTCAEMRASLSEGRMRPEVCIAAVTRQLADHAAAAPEPEPEPEPGAQRRGPEPDTSAAAEREVRECLRCLAVEVEQRADKGPAYYEPAVCYRRRPGRPSCKHGVGCTQMSGWHWCNFDHPPEHPLLASPPRAFPPLSTWSLGSIMLCRHFSRTGRCLFEDSCRFYHRRPTAVDTAAPLPWEAAGGGADDLAGVPAGRRRPRKKRSGYGPTASFRRFLVDTFGVETLRGGAGVLDVAGGAGTLSYELLHLNGVASTIADPRRPCFKRGRKVVSHRRRQSALGEAVAPSLRRYDTPLARPVGDGELPDWAEVWFGPWLWDGTAAPTEAGGSGLVGEATAVRPAELFAKDAREVDRWDRTRGGVGVESGAQPTPLGQAEVAQRLAECSVVIGLHPDGATDAIVDFALAHGKPFALLPCCVYSKSFTKRRTALGGPVRNYEQLLDYLQDKDPAIQRVQLDFDGRNIALFHTGNPAA